MIFGVMPRPAAAFSPFTMMKSSRMFPFQFRQAGDDRAAAGLADDVAEEKNREHGAIIVLNSKIPS